MNKIIFEIPIYNTTALNIEDDIVEALALNGHSLISTKIEPMTKQEIQTAINLGALPDLEELLDN